MEKIWNERMTDNSKATAAKKLYIKTYGCQMNVYDSQRMADVMAPLGYETTESPEEADMVILNTCHIREKAAQKVYSDLGRLKPYKLERQAQDASMLIAVGGCVGQAEGKQIFARAPYVDMVFGPQNYHRLPELVMQALRKEGRAIDLEFPTVDKFDRLPCPSVPEGRAAFLSVQEGCDKFCSFCVVPYTRGAEYSRPVEDVLAEARRLVDQGVVELTLLGQNVNAYHGADKQGNTATLAALIYRLADLSGLKRIRYTTSHPRDMSDDLISAHAELPQLMPYLHLPVQSGSDTVLQAMNRKHTAATYIDIIERLRTGRADMAFSSDFIVGFPGESDRDFEATLQLVRSVGYAQAYSFKYSPRPGTPAATAEQVPEPVKQERLAQLQALLNTQQEAFNQSCVGKEVDVLLEKPGKHPGQWVGRSPYMQAVHVQADTHYLGRIARVRLSAAYANSLRGELCGDMAETAPAAVA